MNNFEERIAELLTLRMQPEAYDIINDLHAALQAKDAEIAELRKSQDRWICRSLGADRLWNENVILSAEISELRGLLGEAQSALDWFIVGELTKVKAFEIIDRVTTALAGKEQPK